MYCMSLSDLHQSKAQKESPGTHRFELGENWGCGHQGDRVGKGVGLELDRLTISQRM